MTTYKIVRRYFSHHPNRRTLMTGLSLEQAQAHCKSPETSSSTCTKAPGARRTRLYGPWFDAYEVE